MKYISFIFSCLIWTTSFSQLPANSSHRLPGNTIDLVNTPWKIERLIKQKSVAVPARHLPDTTISKKIVITYTTDRKGKVIMASYVASESTSSDEQLIKDAKIKTLMAKPVIHTRKGIRCYGTYTFIFSADGKLLLYFQTAWTSGISIY